MNGPEIFAALLAPAGREDPYPLYAELRKLGDALPVMPGAVVVTGYDAISAVLRDPEYLVPDASRLDAVFPAWRDHPSLDTRTLLDLNEPEHARIRRLISRAFTPRRVASLAPAIARMTDSLLDAMADNGASGHPVEFMHDFAFLLPVTVICELIGIPEIDRETFRPLARDLAATLEPGITDELLAAADKATIMLSEYLADLVAERRARPQYDLISALVVISDAQDGRLSDPELLDNLMLLLLVAGFETTTNLLGNGLRIVLDDPSIASALRSGAVPVAAFVEEVLRFDAPVQVTSRRRAGTAQIAGQQVTSEDEIWLMLGAGNRDGRRFTDPDVFSPQRAVSGPLSFGGGGHFRVGAALARLEAAIAFPRLLARFPSLASAGEPQRRNGLVLRGFDALPVTVN